MKLKINKYWQRFQGEKVRYKYFILMMCLSIIPLLLLGFISFSIAKDALVKNQIQMSESHMQTASASADLLFRNISNMERLISWNKDIRQELINSAQYAEKEGNVLDSTTTRRIQDLISSYLFDTQYIDSVCLFDVNFRSVCYGNPKSSGPYDNGGVHSELSETAWYKQSVEAKGRPIFLSTNVLVGTKAQTTFSSVKLLKDPERLYDPQIIGLLVVNINKSMFSEVFNKKDDSHFMIIDSANKEKIMYLDAGSEKIDLDSDFLEKFTDNNQKEYVISSFENRSTGWTFANVIKEKELLKQSNQIGMITAVIALFISIVVLYSSFVLSGSVTRPLIQLKKLTVDWAKGLRGTNGGQGKDEIHVIGETFQRITTENKELNEQLVRAQLREREAELRALQAQIKPHFLYNALDSVYWMAVMKQNEDIAKIAVSLSETFKLSLNKGEDLITVSKELEHIHHYMTIQNIRYDNRFQYIENVEAELVEKKILKLLLQPIVENAIYHGLESKIGEGTVRLTGRIEDGWVTFTISDDGVGIEDMESTKQGYGLTNVIERLQLYYGSQSTLSISSKVHEGTTVEIRFPEK
ncbi:cache domain-containing sensor histidine kinase [Bacillus sinesaloumensis]|uniref:cache domain-containing sensor histidine kinase n=1 Tax=Litchfieldia sinesaloumensis TaxID=1926280 RepID=UPI0009883D67|nr:sensor histidine kinase [Bacillus sinesaloumensis]